MAEKDSTSGHGTATEMASAYDPAGVESKWYTYWEDNKLFSASSAEGDTRQTYTIAIPPPNVTGSLHMGHACRTTFEDVLTRYERMRGKNALWIPGIDHAGIATQVVVERLLKREGTTRQALGREKFIERVWQWKEESGGRILEQLRHMGASCDWDRTHFTLDPDLALAVRESFVRLYEEGLIYRGTRLVNWDIGSQTVLSDLEIDTEENVEGALYDFAYKVEGSDAELVVSTTRPETMLGDTAVAVHPDDARYKDLHGKFLKHPFVERRVPIITDSELVDPEFGTGAVKVTPAHDPNDFATGKRHQLEEINIMNLDGTLNAHAGEFAGLERFKARKAVLAALEEKGLFRGEKKHMMTLPRSQRSGVIVEPLISTQWFVKMEPLAKPAIEVVKNGAVKILPEDWTKTYFHWLRNIQDWCISRQLWWGHAIPAWYCDECEHVTVGREDPTRCGGCGGIGITQDEDVLDTWFSSALWPFSTLGWPNETADLKRFYPTQDMETGYDILFFWVARMIMMGIHFMGEAPFSRVLLAGIVTDERGEKMSKTKGNVVDPLDVIHGASLETLVEKAEKAGAKPGGIKYLKKTYPEGFAAYGADALRMTLLSYSPQSRRIALSIKRIEGYRNFSNKLWNAARYVLGSVGDVETKTKFEASSVKAMANRWILSRLHAALKAAKVGLEEYRLDDAQQALYHFVWDEYCDWYLELSKPLLETDARDETAHTLLYSLEVVLRALHPMMPFITEEIWQKLPFRSALVRQAALSISVARYPEADAVAQHDTQAEKELSCISELVTAVRTIRSENDLGRKQPLTVYYAASENADLLEREASLLGAMMSATLEPSNEAQLKSGTHKNAASIVLPWLRAVVPDVVDPKKEKERLGRELKKVNKDLELVQKKLGSSAFVDKAPEAVVAEARDKRAALEKKQHELAAAVAQL